MLLSPASLTLFDNFFTLVTEMGDGFSVAHPFHKKKERGFLLEKTAFGSKFLSGQEINCLCGRRN